MQELELRRCQAQEEQLRLEAGIGRATDTDGKGQLVYRSVSISSAGRRWSRTISAFVMC